jgi:hypothetical protein
MLEPYLTLFSWIKAMDLTHAGFVRLRDAEVESVLMPVNGPTFRRPLAGRL